MKLTRRTSNILLGMGIVTLVIWVSRLFTFYLQVQEGSLVAPGVHFSLVVISLVIGVYLTYLGVKGRGATRRAP